MSGSPLRHVAARARLAVALLEASPEAQVAQVAEIVRVSADTVYAYWYRAHPGQLPRGRQITAQMRERQLESFAALCDTMAEQLTDRPQTSPQIFARTRAVAGDVHERRLYRALRRLLDARRVRRHRQARDGATCVTYTTAHAEIRDYHYQPNPRGEGPSYRAAAQVTSGTQTLEAAAAREGVCASSVVRALRSGGHRVG